MDIGHTHDAVAVLTLGKDMVLRDFAQGAYRMRGIAAGQVCRCDDGVGDVAHCSLSQRIHLLVIPEVRDLIRRELALADSTCVLDGGGGAVSLTSSSARRRPETDAQLLRDVMAWLVINACRCASLLGWRRDSVLVGVSVSVRNGSSTTSCRFRTSATSGVAARSIRCR